VDSRYYRPTEVDLLIGDPSKAKEKLGWQHKYDLNALCKEMVLADIELFKRDQVLKNAGFGIKKEY
jgi:GDPmannose 4,6-dehydratase